MTNRIRLDDMTDAQLDALHADLERAREQLNKMNGRFNWTANEAAEAQTALESCRRQHLAAVDKGIRVEARAERAEQQLAPVRTALAEVLARFRHDTHPGQRCKQTDHVPVETVERWHAVLDETPEPEGGCAHCGGPHAWDDCQAYSALVTADVAALDDAQQPDPDSERWDTFDARPGTTDYTRQQALRAQQPPVTVHACPPYAGDGLTPCCRRPPPELPRTDRITRDPDAVTCPGPNEGPGPT